MKRRTVRRMLAAMLFSVVALPAARAHPIHTTMATMTLEQGMVTLRIRAFADDISASVAAHAGKAAPSDWSMSEADGLHYAQAMVRVSDARGNGYNLSSCGLTREREVYWLCFRVAKARDVSGLQLVNRLLVDRHDDQVNIVQVKTTTVKRTLLFTRDTKSHSIPG